MMPVLVREVNRSRTPREQEVYSLARIHDIDWLEEHKPLTITKDDVRSRTGEVVAVILQAIIP